MKNFSIVVPAHNEEKFLPFFKIRLFTKFIAKGDGFD